MKFLKIAGLCVLGLVVLVVLLYLIGMAVNWRDQPPSAAALEMKAIMANRPMVADADNGFVYAMGFAVPASEDPQSAGAQRTVWLEAVNRDLKLIAADPVKKDVDFKASKSRSMEKLRNVCGESHSTECLGAFLSALPQPRTALEDLQLQRYRALLSRRAWREVVPLDIRVPIARFGDIIEGQRLLHVDLAARAKYSPAGEVIAVLREDLEFWREVLKSADYLITKMIAVAAIRQHFFFGNLVLRELPADQAKRVDLWSVPFSSEELSMRRTMAGEWTFTEGTLRRWQDGNDGRFMEPSAEGLTLWGRFGSSLARPYYQHQDQMNHYAAIYLDFAKRFEAPLDQYSRISRSEAAEPPGLSFHVYNAVGEVIRGIAGTWDISSYAMRVGSVEGMRRAALLTAQLRDHGVPFEAIADELKKSDLNNPFDGQPFEWNPDEKAVVYEGPDAERSRSQHPYFY